MGRLNSSNDWQRDKIHQLLLWRQAVDAAEPLRQLYRSSQLPEVRLQAMAVLYGLNQLQAEDLLRMLADPHPRVRQWAVRWSEETDDARVWQRLRALQSDADPRVGLQLVLTLGTRAESANADPLLQLAARLADDPFIRTAVVSGLPHYASALVRAMGEDGSDALARYHLPVLQYALGADRRELLIELLEQTLAGGASDDSTAAAQWLDAHRAIGATIASTSRRQSS